MEVSSHMLNAYNILYPAYDVNTALMNLKLAKLCNVFGNLERAHKLLHKCMQIFLGVYGIDHPFVINVVKPLFDEVSARNNKVLDHSG